MVVQAAVQGLGVALGREPLVIDALGDGRLVRPLDGVAVSQFSYWFVCPKAAMKSERILQFHEWLFQEARAGLGRDLKKI
jgi:LysR family glycine cleavage system transcriptional activator